MPTLQTNLPDISNWRSRPYSQWAFQHVRQVLPSALISAPINKPEQPDDSLPGSTFHQQLDALTVDSPSGRCTLESLLQQGCTDGFTVRHNNRQVYQWQCESFDPQNPHILFSVSKSFTALLAGILQQQGLLEPDQMIVHYLPGCAAGVYGQCTVRQLLDMTVALDFEENYTDPQSEYMRYRVATGWNPVNQLDPGDGLEDFLYSLRSITGGSHGKKFLYRSPNSDLLGLVLERSAGMPLAQLFSELLWQPMQASTDGYITLDRYGLARAAGGICVTLSDLAGVGQLMLDQGAKDGRQVIPASWIVDTFSGGDRQAWQLGNYLHKLPEGKYRNQWYQVGDPDGCLHARGIHGQLLYINPARSVVIARLSSQAEPLDDTLTSAMLNAFQQVSRALSASA